MREEKKIKKSIKHNYTFQNKTMRLIFHSQSLWYLYAIQTENFLKILQAAVTKRDV